LANNQNEMNLKHDVQAVARQFQLWGAYLGAEPYGSGHINDTYCVRYDQAGTSVRYIFQRINHHVFKRPAALMENVSRVTTHLVAKIGDQADAARRTLTLVPAWDGRPFYADAEGNHWRVYLFIE
jgi:hypothetical protein